MTDKAELPHKAEALQRKVDRADSKVAFRAADRPLRLPRISARG
jgi:hypothetical protein